MGEKLRRSGGRRSSATRSKKTLRPFGGPEGQRQFIFGYSSTGSRSKNTWFPEASTGRETCPFIYVIYVVTQGGKHSITQLPLRLSDRTKVRSNENSFRSLARFTRSGPARGRERFSAQPDGMKVGRSPQVGALPPTGRTLCRHCGLPDLPGLTVIQRPSSKTGRFAYGIRRAGAAASMAGRPGRPACGHYMFYKFIDLI